MSILSVGSQNEKKNSGRLLISASATVGALLLVALMCFWGCFLYKKLGKNDAKGLAKDVSGGEVHSFNDYPFEWKKRYVSASSLKRVF